MWGKGKFPHLRSVDVVGTRGSNSVNPPFFSEDSIEDEEIATGIALFWLKEIYAMARLGKPECLSLVTWYTPVRHGESEVK